MDAKNTCDTKNTPTSKARVCWHGPSGEPVHGRWQNEVSAQGMADLMKLLLGERLCWLEYQH